MSIRFILIWRTRKVRHTGRWRNTIYTSHINILHR